MTTISLILAHDDAGGIGLKNGLPWERIPEDMDHFRSATKGHSIVMGRKTFESLGCKPLPGRLNIVISSQYGEEAVTPRYLNTTSLTSVSLVKSLEKAFKVAIDNSPSFGYPIFVIGGKQIYEQALPYASQIILTKVSGVHEADTSWKPDLTDWIVSSEDSIVRDGRLVCLIEKHYRFFPDKEL